MHELRRDSDAEKVIRAAYDAAAQDPDKAIHVFIACGSDSTVNAGAALETAACLGSLLCFLPTMQLFAG